MTKACLKNHKATWHSARLSMCESCCSCALTHHSTALTASAAPTLAATAAVLLHCCHARRLHCCRCCCGGQGSSRRRCTALLRCSCLLLCGLGCCLGRGGSGLGGSGLLLQVQALNRRKHRQAQAGTTQGQTNDKTSVQVGCAFCAHACLLQSAANHGAAQTCCPLRNTCNSVQYTNNGQLIHRYARLAPNILPQY